MSNFILYAGVAALLIGLFSIPFWALFVIMVLGAIYVTL